MARCLEVGSFYNEHDNDEGADVTAYYDTKTGNFFLIDDATAKVLAEGSIDDVADAAESATGHFADELASHIAGYALEKGVISKDDAKSFGADVDDEEPEAEPDDPFTTNMLHAVMYDRQYGPYYADMITKKGKLDDEDFKDAHEYAEGIKKSRNFNGIDTDYDVEYDGAKLQLGLKNVSNIHGTQFYYDPDDNSYVYIYDDKPAPKEFKTNKVFSDYYNKAREQDSARKATQSNIIDTIKKDKFL